MFDFDMKIVFAYQNKLLELTTDLLFQKIKHQIRLNTEKLERNSIKSTG